MPSYCGAAWEVAGNVAAPIVVASMQTGHLPPVGTATVRIHMSTARAAGPFGLVVVTSPLYLAPPLNLTRRGATCSLMHSLPATNEV